MRTGIALLTPLPRIRPEILLIALLMAIAACAGPTEEVDIEQPVSRPAPPAETNQSAKVRSGTAIVLQDRAHVGAFSGSRIEESAAQHHWPTTPADRDRYVEQPVSIEAAGLKLKQDCSEPGNELSAGGMRVCVLEDHLEIREAVTGTCNDALRLKHGGGEVSLGAAADGLEILVDGATVWQVGCVDGVWELEER